jgi:hypothetical protein
MTAARPHRKPPASHRLAWRRRCERYLAFGGVLLPIPLFAASGLSLPLPAAVERLAAALVPWAEAATNGNQLVARGPGGSIVRLGGEQEDATSYALGESAPTGAEDDRTAPGKDVGTGPSPADVSTPKEGPEGGATREQPATQEPVKADSPREEPGSGDEPAPPPPPPPPPTPPLPTDPVREIVDGTVAPVDRTVGDVVDTVDKLVPIVGHPPPVLPGLGK